MYSFLYGNDSFQLCTSVKFGNELYLNGSVLGSKNSRSIRSSFILAFWSIGNGQLAHTCSDLSPHSCNLSVQIKIKDVSKLKILQPYYAIV